MNSKLYDRINKLSPKQREILFRKLAKEKDSNLTKQKITKRKDPNIHPLSYAQKRMWFHNQLAPNTSLNNISAGLRLHGELNVELLQFSFNKVIERHEILRSAYPTENGAPVQIIHKNLKLELPIVNLLNIKSSIKEKEVKKIAIVETRTPFNLSEAPLLRIKLIKLEENEYILLLTIHHIISDGWSTGVLINEISQIYSSILLNKNLNLPELTIHYSDYAVWQQEQLQGENLNSLTGYWKQQLAGAPPLLKLRTDRPRPKSPNFEGDHINLKVDKDLSLKLKQLGNKIDVTLFMTIVAAFNMLLYRITGQKDICVGSPVSNREQIEIENLIGFFVNVIVLRTTLNENITFIDLLKKVKNNALGAYAHQQMPFEKIVEELDLPKTLSYNPLFQVLVDFQNNDNTSIKLPNLEVTPFKIKSNMVKYDLVLSIKDKSDGIEFILGYNKVLFDEFTVLSILKSFETILKEIIANPFQKISSINLLNKEYRKKIIKDWNCKEINNNMEKDSTVFNLFEEQARRFPNDTATIFIPQTSNNKIDILTNSQFNEKANQLANYLLKLGSKTESKIGICLDRSNEMIISIFGILKAGGTYVPIDPNTPAGRLSYIIEITNLNFVITKDDYKSKFNNYDLNIISFPEISAKLKLESKNNINKLIESNNLAYIIFTSGSTGIPKGVMVTHRGLKNHSLNTINNYSLTKSDKILQYLSLNFDAAAEEIFPALLSNTTLVVPEIPIELTGGKLVNFIDKYNITIMHLPVAIWHNLVDYISRGNIKIPDCIRLVCVGGESPSPNKLLNFFEQTRNGTKFYNMYGPTETTIACSYYKVNEKFDKNLLKNLIPIGKPLVNVSMYILDKSFNPVPIGVLGEIFISGVGVARGYINKPELTAEKFIPDPFTNSFGTRMYRTGDLAYYLPDGNFVYEARNDNQVKIRGFRIELNEIESVIKSFNLTKHSAVIITEDEKGTKRIIAYVVLKNKFNENIRKLKNYISAHLPDYMIPSSIIVLDYIPLTPTGKIDRQLLKTKKIDSLAANVILKEPTTELEKSLSNMWCDILGIEQIGIHDNFFELGGDSIQAATFVNRLQDKLGEYVYIVALYDAPTISELVNYLKQNYSESLEKLIGKEYKNSLNLEANESQIIKLISKDFNNLQNIAWYPSSPSNGNERIDSKNEKKILFVLSSPRSGSTLLRAMLGGNPNLFSPPELQLLNYNSLKERKNKLSGRDSFWLDGTTRAIMEIKSCSVDEAEKIIGELESKNLSVKDFYRILQEWLGERIFVDKTPNYALSEKILIKAEDYFENAYYIHLIRHPYGVIPSFEKAKLHVFYPPFFNEKFSFNSRQLAELVWVISHKNILSFLSRIPDSRKIRVSYEDLVTEPEKQMKILCEFLNIKYSDLMLAPQSDVKHKMTDGLNNLSKMLGDVRFHEHKGINSSRAYEWKNKIKVDFLSDQTWELAQKLGYERISNESKMKVSEHSSFEKLEKIKKVDRTHALPLSFSQQRLWFLEKLESDNAIYNLPSAIRLIGNLNISVLEKSINTLISRHEILRTGVREMEGKPYLIIKPSLNFKIQQIEIKSNNGEDVNSQVKRIIKDEATKEFNLTNVPLIRIKLLKIASNNFVLLVNMHHIISDGMSLNIFIRELSSVYNAFVTLSSPRLPSLQIQYPDFAYWQRNWLDSDLFKKQLAFWKEKLNGISEVSSIPTVYPRPSKQSYNGRHLNFRLKQEQYDAIKIFCSQNGITSYSMLVTIFNILIFRYSGNRDIIIGTPVSGRNRKELEGLIGFFVNTLVLRNMIKGNPTFTEFLQAVNQEIREAIHYQEIPLEKVVDLIQPERSLSHAPIFQIMFVFNKIKMQDIKLSNLAIEPIPIDTGISKFDLTLSLTETENRLNGTIEYNTDLFDEDYIKFFIEHFQNLIDRLIKEPEVKITNVDFLNSRLKKNLLKNWNNTSSEIESSKLIHNLFEEQAKKNPHKIAVSFGKEQISYDNLNKKANRIANFLRENKIGAEKIVGVFLERSIETISVIFGIMKAGGVYLPIDIDYPPERIKYILDDSNLKFLITTNNMRSRFSRLNIPTVAIDDLSSKLDKYTSYNLNSDLSSLNLAYIIYTSGSMGKPKGTLLNHLGLCNNTLNLINKFYLTSKSNVLQFASYGFDASIGEIFPTLICGGTLYLIDKDHMLPGSGLEEIIKENNITQLTLPPSIAGNLNPSDFSEVDLLVTAGEVCHLDFAKRWSKSKRLINGYGPTENTIVATTYLVDYAKLSYSVPIGTPVNNVKVYVLDKFGNFVPPGVPGELHLEGLSIARGYLNQPALTAEKFIPNAFSNKPGSRLYKTGDKVKFLNDGNLDFVGRVDNQIKLRGFRIEIGEIEIVLSSHPVVQTAIVLLNTQYENAKKLIAFYKLKPESLISQKQIRDYLTSILPEYMIPNYLVEIDKIPLTTNGKIDKKALLNYEIKLESEEMELGRPLNELELKLINIWHELLRIKNISIFDNFFELGGDSILTIQVVAKAKREGIVITPKQIFEFPTIKQLVEVANTTVPINAEQGLVVGTAPLTPIQKWFINLKLDNIHHWNQSLFVELNEEMNFDYLEKVIKLLIAQHDVLRMKIVENIDLMMELNESINGSIFEIVDLTDWETENYLEKIHNSCLKAQSSLNIFEGPIIKVLYFKQHYNFKPKLFITIHHLAIDGVSWRIILEDIMKSYQSLISFNELPKIEKTTSFMYWAKKLNEYSRTPKILGELDYWSKLLDEKIEKVPVDFSSDLNIESSARSLKFELNRKKTDLLQNEVSKISRTTINELLLSTFTLAYYKWSGINKIYIDIEGHGREEIFEEVDLTRTVGWFTVSFPINIKIYSHFNLPKHINSIKEQFRAVPNKGIGFGILRYLSSSDLTKDLANINEPEIGFNYLGKFDQVDENKIDFGRVIENSSYERDPKNMRVHKIDFSAKILDGKLLCSISFSNNIFNEQSIKKFMTIFKNQLEELIAGIDSESKLKLSTSDFQNVDLSEEDLDNLITEIEE